MSTILCVVSLINLCCLLLYVSLLAYSIKNKRQIDLRKRKIQMSLSFVICVMFAIILCLEVDGEQTWKSKYLLDLLSFFLWAVCTVFEVLNWKREKAIKEKEDFLKKLNSQMSQAYKVSQVEENNIVKKD